MARHPHSDGWSARPAASSWWPGVDPSDDDPAAIPFAPLAFPFLAVSAPVPAAEPVVPFPRPAAAVVRPATVAPVPSAAAAAASTETAAPIAQGGYDSTGTYYTPATAAMTHFGGTPAEIVFAAFDPSALLNRNIAEISSAKLSFAVSTSDVADIGTFSLNEYSFIPTVQNAIVAEQTDYATYNGPIQGDDGYNLVQGALRGLFDTEHADLLGSASTLLQGYSIDVTADILDALGRGDDAVFAFSVADGGASYVVNPTLTVTGSALGISGTEPGQPILSSNVHPPFSNVSFGDPEPNTDDTVMITIEDDYGNGTAALGTLSGGSDLTSFGDGNYSLAAGNTGQLTQEIRALNYHPAAAPAGTTYTAHFEIDFQTDTEGAISDDNTSVVVTGDACYLEGTRIATEGGEVPVERLRVGDLVRTASGRLRPVRWLGRRRLDCSRHRHPAQVWPIRVDAGAFGPGLPGRALWLSPAHRVAANGVLIPVRRLCNGRTITQVPTDRVTYWHVELDEHDLLLAENLPAESYLEDGNRDTFEGGAALSLHPDLSAMPRGEACLPVRERGSAVAATKRDLIGRAAAGGCGTTTDPAPRIGCGDDLLPPCWRNGDRVMLALPRRGAEPAVLRSRRWIPAHMLAHSDDERELGVCVLALTVDGVSVPLDSPALGAGWHDVEQGPAGSQRWTAGAATLPPGRVFGLRLAPGARYWEEDAPDRPRRASA